MKINLSQSTTSLIDIDVIAKAEKDLKPSEITIEDDRNTGIKIVKVGLCKWIDGEHGEEDILRYCCRAIIDNAKKSGHKDIVIDTVSFSEFFECISYVINILIEEFADILTKKNLECLTITLLISENVHSEDISDELGDALAKPVFETVSHSYGDYGDPLKEQFKEFQKSLSQEKTFREYLVDLMDKKGIRKNTEVYKPSGISKYTFSRLTNFSINPPHKPSKETVAALTIGLKLQIEEAEEFYNVAGYSLSKTEFVDKVIRFFIHKKIYKIDEVNYCLAHHGYPLLGERMRGESMNIIIK